MTFELTNFYAYLLAEKRVAANTFSAYKRDIEQFTGYLADNKIDLPTMKREQLKSYLKYLKESLGLTARSISRKIAALKILFLYMHEYNQVPNLAEDLISPKLEKRLPSYLSEEEVHRLLQEAEKDSTDIGMRNKVLLYLLYATGMRITELVSLPVSAIHFDTGFIDVQGKGGKVRMVPLPEHTLALLREYLAQVHGALIKHSTIKTDYFFPVIYGGGIKHISRQAVWIVLKKLCAKAGMNRSIHPHQLRHSLATHMLKNGADLRSIQILLGHENLSTVEIYTHVETSHLRKIYDKKHPRS